MKRIVLFLILFISFSSQAKLRNCNTCNSGCRINQTCCFEVKCPEDCNPYSCNPHCENVSDPKCIYDPSCGKYYCICG